MLDVVGPIIHLGWAEKNKIPRVFNAYIYILIDVNFYKVYVYRSFKAYVCVPSQIHKKSTAILTYYLIRLKNILI